MKAYIKLKYFFILSVIALCSCKNENKTIVLNFEAELSSVYEKSLIRDSIVVQVYSNDSILLLKYSNGDYKQSRYFNMNDAFFERRISVTEVGKFVRIDSILTFSKKDTVFKYGSARKFIPFVQDYSFADCIYSIKHEGNEYKTIKQSAIDTTYKEIFFYDHNYHIYKYVNMWKDNKCVYVKKE
jgi:hypothetical protein